MEVQTSLRSKYLYKTVLLLIKFIPVLMSLVALLNTILSYFYIDWGILSYLSGVSLFLLILMYAQSYAFKFCKWHRLLIHYISLNWLLNIIDYYVGIPLSNRNLFLLYMIFTGIVIVLLVYIIVYEYHNEKCCKNTKRNSRQNRRR